MITISDIKFTEVKVPKFTGTIKNNDKYALIVDEDSKYLDSCKTRYNDCFYFYKADTIIGASLRHYGEYTDIEVQLLNSVLQPGYIVYDIGANIGYHTLGLCQKAKHVYAFEPNKKNYKLLKLNTSYNKNVTNLNVACSNKKGTLQIEDFDLNTYGNFGECRIVEVGQLTETVVIDELVQTNKIEPPNLIKIDVEGHEYEVVLGMLDTIKNNLPVIMYEHLHGDNLPKIHELLVNMGYKIYWFPVPNYNVNNFYKNKENIFGNGGVMNVVAFPFYLNVDTNLPEKLSATETWNDCVTRLQNAQKN